MSRVTRSFALLFATLPTMLFAVTVSLSVNPSRCGQGNGFIVAIADGGIPPYTYLWSNGATTPTISGLSPGAYSVTVTDGLSNTDQATGTVLDVPELNMPFAFEMRSDCANSCSGWAQMDEAVLGGTAPYVYDFPFVSYWGPNTAIFQGVCATGTPVHVSDAGGCSVDFMIWVTNSPGGWPDVQNITAACGGGANGSVELGGDFGFAWYKVTGAAYDSVYYFAAAPYIISGLQAGTYDIQLWDPSGPMTGQPEPVYCTFPSQAVVPSVPGPCGTINGRVYHDADQDCLFNGADFGQPYRVISIEPGGAFAISDGNGQYQQNVGYGTYQISQSAVPQETQICPVNTPQSVLIDALNNNAVVDFANLSAVPHDLSISLIPASARPGFPTQVWIHVSNNSAFPSGDVTVDLTYDPVLTNANPGTGQWILPSIAPYGQFHALAQALVPANINLLGTVLNYTATVGNTVSEVNTANNTATASMTITGSYDPNDKSGLTSSRSSDAQYFLSQDEWVDYTVRFQNTGTAAAETVVIRDELDTDLDILSLEIIGASHPFEPSFGNGHELVFTFSNINLPDSTSDLLGSQGFVSYRIKPRGDIMVGDVLENTAGIHFDFNPPIITNTTSHVVDFSTSIAELTSNALRAFPVPAADELRLISGSPVRSIEVFSIDGRRIPISLQPNGVIDVRSLAGGSYFLRARLLNGEHPTLRFQKR